MKDQKEKKKIEIKLNKKTKTILIIVLAIVFIASVTYLCVYIHNSIKNKRLYDELYEGIERDETTDQIRSVSEGFIEKVKELQQENSDVKGWIRIENTNINYPLLQTTNNEYYVTHNYKKQKSSYGSIFINSKSNIKSENANVIIYGHDMKDNQMFKDLLKYSDKQFYDEHPIVKIFTEEGEQTYKIIYAFKSRVFYKDEKNVFRYYQYYDFKNEKKYNEYINNCKKIQLYDTGETASYGEQLITLITCEYSQENGRMVVVAKKIES